MKQKKILLLGGSAQQVIAIKTAKELGYYTVLCDYLSDNPGQYVADKYYNMGTQTLYLCENREQYDAIIKAINNGVITPIEDNDDIVEISSEDIPVLAKVVDVKIDLEKEKEHKKVRELTRTIYVKDKIEFIMVNPSKLSSRIIVSLLLK